MHSLLNVSGTLKQTDYIMSNYCAHFQLVKTTHPGLNYVFSCPHLASSYDLSIHPLLLFTVVYKWFISENHPQIQGRHSVSPSSHLACVAALSIWQTDYYFFTSAFLYLAWVAAQMMITKSESTFLGSLKHFIQVFYLYTNKIQDIT